jgi:hypothetical protein
MAYAFLQQVTVNPKGCGEAAHQNLPPARIGADLGVIPVMTAPKLLSILLGVCVFAAGCATASDVQPAAPHPGPVAVAAPAECQRDHVYVFLVNGLDPFFFCQFNKMPGYVRSLGYEHVSMGQMTARSRFVDEIRHIRASDASARIVLLGFSTGANTVCRMSHALNDEGCKVDLLIYLGGCYIYNADSSRPENAARIVNIRDSGLVMSTGTLVRGDNLDGAENIQIPGLTLHIMTPIDPITQDTVARELDQLAVGVPIAADAAATAKTAGPRADAIPVGHVKK